MKYADSKAELEPIKAMMLNNEMFIPSYGTPGQYVMRGGLTMNEVELRRRKAAIITVPLWPRPWLKETYIP